MNPYNELISEFCQENPEFNYSELVELLDCGENTEEDYIDAKKHQDKDKKKKKDKNKSKY